MPDTWLEESLCNGKKKKEKGKKYYFTGKFNKILFFFVFCFFKI